MLFSWTFLRMFSWSECYCLPFLIPSRILLFIICKGIHILIDHSSLGCQRSSTLCLFLVWVLFPPYGLSCTIIFCLLYRLVLLDIQNLLELCNLIAPLFVFIILDPLGILVQTIVWRTHVTVLLLSLCFFSPSCILRLVFYLDVLSTAFRRTEAYLLAVWTGRRYCVARSLLLDIESEPRCIWTAYYPVSVSLVVLDSINVICFTF
jgi:hypothetical protein